MNKLQGTILPLKSTEAISKGFDTATKNLVMFIPSLAPIVVHLFFLFLAYVVFPVRYNYFSLLSSFLATGGYFLAALFGFVASCMVVDMANDSINGQPIDLTKSINVVLGRLGDLIIAAIITAVFFITFFLIPVALFIITITIIEKTSAIESTKKAIDFVLNNLGEVIIFIILVIIVWFVFDVGFSVIPFIGPFLGSIISWLLNVVLTVAAVHFYLSLRPAPPPQEPESTTE